jgi:DNA polymerase III subunit delta
VRAVISDAAALELDELIDAAFAGRAAQVEAEFARVVAAGTSLSSILFAALRQVGLLHRARVAIEAGTPVGAQLESMYVHFSRKADVETALRAWTAPRLERAMAQLADAQLESRRQATLAEPIAMRALMWLAVNAKRKAA